MRDFLDYVESNYGCVAEYNRCMEERDTYESGYEPTWDEIREEEDEISYEEQETELRQFEIGDRKIQYGFYGGITTYIVQEIDRENGKILLAEEWVDVDGNGTRPDEWHKLVTNDDGNEMALEWTSEEYGDVWIFA